LLEPDGRTLLVADSNDSGIIQEYAFDSAAPALRLVRNIQGRETGGATITFNPAGDRFVSHGWDNIFHLYDAVSGQVLFSGPGLSPASPILLRFDRTGQRLAGARVGDRKDRIGVWSVADAREYRSLVPAENGVNPRPAVHPDSRLAAIGSTDGVALFDLEAGKMDQGHRTVVAVISDDDGEFMHCSISDRGNEERRVLGTPPKSTRSLIVFD
jgi:WD40 repeat protein